MMYTTLPPLLPCPFCCGGQSQITASKHWHDLYRAECLRRHDDAARYNGQVIALEEEREAYEWRPVDTSPHDEFVLLGWYDYCGEWQWDVGSASHGECNSVASNISRHGQATHWIPLPPAPAIDPQVEQP